MGRLGSLILKGTGVLVLAFIALSVIATIVGILFSVVATIVSLLVTVAVLGLLVLGAVGLFSMLRDGSSDSSAGTYEYEYESADRARDPKSQLQERYVAGELSEAEFERELDRVLESDDGRGTAGRTRSEPDRSRTRDFDRTNR